MKIKMVRNTVANLKPRAIGEVIDVDDAEGVFLINLGKAVAYKQEAVASKPKRGRQRKSDD